MVWQAAIWIFVAFLICIACRMQERKSGFWVSGITIIISVAGLVFYSINTDYLFLLIHVLLLLNGIYMLFRVVTEQ